MSALWKKPRKPEDPFRAALVRAIVKHPWMTLAALASAAAIGSAVVLLSGVAPITASSGHWWITATLLDFAKVRSVATHSLTIEPPPLDDEAMIIRGAAHYETGCSPCHGRPGAGVPPVMQAMTPHPPELTLTLPRYKPEQLFYIVKHGIKFTGMPGWPVQQRDDEVWAVVAFLLRLPQLDAEAYRRLAYGNSTDVAPASPTDGVQAPQAVLGVCSRCHGTTGTGRALATFPSLAGQRAEYLYASLRAFADRSRHSGIMGVVAANLSDDAMRGASTYYAGLPPREGESIDASAVQRGQAIAAHGAPDRDIPACVECHGPTEVPKNPAYPRLAGQDPRYLVSQLGLLKQRRRGGTPNVTLMHVFVDRLSADQIRDVTLYYGSIGEKQP